MDMLHNKRCEAPPVWPGGLFRAGSRGQYFCATLQGRNELHQPDPQWGALWTELLKSGPPAWEAERDPKLVNPLSPGLSSPLGNLHYMPSLSLDWLLLSGNARIHTQTRTYLVISCWSLPKLSSKNKWFEGNSCGICMQLKGRKARCVW